MSIELARDIARIAHAGQQDKQGQPYINHPERVAMAVKAAARAAGWDAYDVIMATQVAWLHDVIEDTTVALGGLGQSGFDPRVIDAVDALTRRRDAQGKPEGYHRDFIPRCKANRIAALVKRCDIHGNLSRIDGLPAEQRDGMRRRYERALALLEGGGR